jgi:hypothetical protein
VGLYCGVILLSMRAIVCDMCRLYSVDNVRVGSEEVGARRRLAPTGSTLQVKANGA